METKKLASQVRGRIVSDLESSSRRLELRFSDGSALIFESTPHGLDVGFHEVRRSQEGSRDRPTARQRQYLEFIRKYMARHGVSPAESDISNHFMVSAPSAHLMVKTLERRGFIERDRDLWGNIVPRSIRVLVD